jgi:glycosyltransferase involved in cell wall biosynthesis
MVLVGTKGWMFDKIFNELDASADIRDRIIITGFVHDSDLAAIYSDAAMFVYPSFYEGFGLPPLEAMKCGVPVISSNTSSLPEVVGDAGIMVAPTDLTALTQAMLSVYNDNALQQQMRAKSLERAAKFSWERCAHETVTAYKRSIGG